jgi:hypothetical protein
LIPTVAVVASYESTTQMDFANGDGWVMSQDYAMHVLLPLLLVKDLPRMPMQLDHVRRLGPDYGAFAMAAFDMSVTTLRSSSQISRW